MELTIDWIPIVVPGLIGVVGIIAVFARGYIVLTRRHAARRRRRDAE